MSERGVTQEEIHAEARNHVRLILPLLERIGSGSAAQVSAGYVKYDDRQERFTCMGMCTVTLAEIVAWDSAMYLYEEVLGETTGKQDTRLLSDVSETYSGPRPQVTVNSPAGRRKVSPSAR